MHNGSSTRQYKPPRFKIKKSILIFCVIQAITQIIFMLLKDADIITWSWYLVLLPSWLPALTLAIALIFSFIFLVLWGPDDEK